MGRMSEHREDEELNKLANSWKCMCCGENFKRGGIFFGFNEMSMCSSCVGKHPEDMKLESLGYILADAYLDSHTRDHKTPLEFVKPIITELEKILYYSISMGIDRETKQKGYNHGS